MKGSLALIDVGANDGSWANSVMKQCKARSPQATIRLILIEPQQHFARKLEIISQQWHATVIHSVAWKHEGNLTLHIGSNRETTSLVKAMASRFGVSRDGEMVPAVDLAALVSHEQQPNKTLLKIDIEGGEYRLIPTLIRRGTFCGLSHIIVEWHLNAMPPRHRLSCLGLRLSFDWLVRNSCEQDIFIAHSEYFVNNEFEHVPGLWREVQRHNRSAHPLGLSESRWEAVHRLEKQRHLLHH